MLKKIAGRIVNRQVVKGCLPDGEREVYTYAYEVLLNQLINILISVIIAVCMRDFLTVTVFLVSYIPLRSYCGGYHAKTHLGCSAASAILLVLLCTMMRMLHGQTNEILALAAFLFSGVLIFLYAPVENKNKPLDEAERCCYRKRGRIIWLTEVLIALLLLHFDGRFVRAEALTHLTFCIMLYIEVLKNRITVRKR